MKAAAPETCGQAMEVPDLIPKFDGLLRRGISSGSDLGIVAASMFTPGARTSGWTIKHVGCSTIISLVFLIMKDSLC